MTTTLKVNPEIIRATRFFDTLTPFMQKITLNRRTLMVIENGLNVAHHIGFEKWDQQTQATYVARMLVRELFESQKAEIST